MVKVIRDALTKIAPKPFIGIFVVCFIIMAGVLIAYVDKRDTMESSTKGHYERSILAFFILSSAFLSGWLFLVGFKKYAICEVQPDNTVKRMYDK